MKPVVQEEISGCGIASVATLAGVTYREAKAAANKLGIFAEDRNLWSDTRHVRTLLENFGISAGQEEIPFSSWEGLPELTLLSIKWHLEDGRPFWHWVVCLRSANDLVVFDPKKILKTNERKDFGRMKPKCFIPIKATSSIAAKRGTSQAVDPLRLP